MTLTSGYINSAVVKLSTKVVRLFQLSGFCMGFPFVLLCLNMDGAATILQGAAV